MAALLELGCVAGQGFLFAKAGSLEELSNSPFVARRGALWTVQSGREELSATGRFRALRPSSAGAPARPDPNTWQPQGSMLGAGNGGS